MLCCGSGLGYANSIVLCYSFTFYLGIMGLIKAMNSEVSLLQGWGKSYSRERKAGSVGWMEFSPPAPWKSKTE